MYKLKRERDFFNSSFGLNDLRVAPIPKLRRTGKVFMGSSSQTIDLLITNYVKQLEILSRFTKKDLVGKYKQYKNIYKKTEKKENHNKQSSGYDFLTRKQNQQKVSCSYPNEKTSHTYNSSKDTHSEDLLQIATISMLSVG